MNNSFGSIEQNPSIENKSAKNKGSDHDVPIN